MSREAEKDRSEDTDLGLLFALAYRAYVQQLHEALRAQGFPRARPSYGPVLRALRASETTLSALAAQFGITKQATSAVVDQMRADGLVEQRPDERDRRARVLSLTGRGQAMADAAVAFSRGFEQRLQCELGAAGAAAFRGALEHQASAAGASGELARRLRPLW